MEQCCVSSDGYSLTSSKFLNVSAEYDPVIPVSMLTSVSIMLVNIPVLVINVICLYEYISK